MSRDHLQAMLLRHVKLYSRSQHKLRSRAVYFLYEMDGGGRGRREGEEENDSVILNWPHDCADVGASAGVLMCEFCV